MTLSDKWEEYQKCFNMDRIPTQEGKKEFLKCARTIFFDGALGAMGILQGTDPEKITQQMLQFYMEFSEQIKVD